MANQKENFAKEKMLKEIDGKDYHEIDIPYKKGKHVTNTSRKVFVGILIVFNILLMISLLILVVKWREDRKNSLAPREQTVCVACTEMGLDGEKLPDKVKGKISLDKNDPKKSLCCGYTSAVLDRMVSKAIKDRGTGVKSSLHLFETKECKKTRKEVPSAQMNGISMPHIAQGTTDVIHWNTTSVKNEGVTYSNGRLTTKQQGYYYIFSQVKFRNSDRPPSNIDMRYDTISLNEKEPGHLDHFIYRYSSQDGKTVKILESSKSRCEVPSLNDETTSSIGAVFYLAENDKVFVNTSHPLYLVPSQEGNHFGIYLT